MAKVIAPNKQYNGISAGVNFKEGVGETSDPHLIKWFKAKGYAVEEEKPKRRRRKPVPVEESAEAKIEVEILASAESMEE